jgi:hypothetical protein
MIWRRIHDGETFSLVPSMEILGERQLGWLGHDGLVIGCCVRVKITRPERGGVAWIEMASGDRVGKAPPG